MSDVASPFDRAQVTNRYTTGNNFEQGSVLRAGPGILLGVRVLIDAALGADRWLHVFNAVAIPANGSIPVYRVAVPGTAIEAFDDFPRGFLLDTGMTIQMSSTIDTLTATVGENWMFSAFFI